MQVEVEPLLKIAQLPGCPAFPFSRFEDSSNRAGVRLSKWLGFVASGCQR
jgi:hypothetical protein